MSDYAIHASKRKDAKKISFVFLSIFMLVVSMISPYLTPKAKAATLERFETIFAGKMNVQQAPNVVIINDQTEIPSDYQFIMKTTEDTSVRIFGTVKGAKTYKTNLNAYPDGIAGTVQENIVTAIPLEGNANGAYGAIYENVGVYKGRPVDVKMTILDYTTWVTADNEYRPHVYINSKQMGINVGGADVKVRYEFLDGDTGKTLTVKGIFSIADIDAYQGVEIYNSPTNPQKIYATANSNIKYSPTKNGFGLFSDSFNVNGDVTAENPNHIATLSFESNAIEFKFYQDRFPDTYKAPMRVIKAFTYNATNYQPGDIIAWNVAEAWKKANSTLDSTQYFIYDGLGYTDINIGASYFEISPYKPLRTAISTPVKTVSDLDEDSVKENTLTKYDETFTYTIEHFVPAEYAGFVYNSYVFTDDLEDVLEVQDVRIKNEVGDDVTKYFNVVIDAKTSKVTATALASVLGQTQLPISTFYNHSYYFEIDAKIKSGANLKNYTSDVDNFVRIPNTASIAVDGTAYPTNEVITKIDVTTYENDFAQITKTVNGVATYTLNSETETFRYGIEALIPPNVTGDEYKITDTLEDVLTYVGNPTVTLTNGNNSIKVNNQLVQNGNEISLTLTADQLANYATGSVKIEFDARVKEGADLEKYKVDEVPTIPNKAEVTWSNKTIESNVVTVQMPIAEKRVNGKKHLDLTNRDQIFNYEITTVVPSDATEFVVTDTLEDVLKFSDPKGVFVNMNADVKIDGQTLTVKLSEADIKANANQTLHISFSANIREKADLTDYIQDDNLIPNTAVITINGNKVNTNKVTVKPPQLVKLVNGKEHVNLSTINDKFTYTIDALVPEDISSFEIQDELEPVLEVVSMKFENVTDDETIKDVTPQEQNNLVLVTMSKKIAEKYANKAVRLTIVAKIKEGADLSTYQNVVPNEAEVLIDNVRTTSEKVTVKAPYLSKKVNGVDDYTLTTKDEIFEYTIRTSIPSKADSFELVDELAKELEVVGTPKFSVDGVTPTVTKDNDKYVVKVKMTKKQVNDNADTDVVLTIKARIKEGADLSKYKDSKVPNYAVATIDGEDHETETVYVQPPQDIKLVNGKEHADLAKRDEVFTYTIETVIPTGKSSFVVTDTLVDELEIKSEPTSNLRATIVDNVEVSPPKIVTNGQKVQMSFNAKEINAYQGQKLVITFDAKIRDNANINKYKDYKIPNNAVITIDNAEKTTNDATVTPPVDGLVKKVNGQSDLTLSHIDEEFTYTIDYKVPNSISELIIKDELVNVLDLKSVKMYNVTDSKEITLGTVTAKNNVATAEFYKDDVAQLANKVIQMQIVAKIKDGADLSTYNNVVPNTAYVLADNTKIESNKVTVTPPKVEKTVNGVENYALLTTNEIVKYEIKTTLPLSADSFEITDELVTELEVVGEPKFSIAGVNVNVDGKKVSVKMNKSQIEANPNKEVTLTIYARIMKDANLTAYADGKVPNKATVLTNGKSVESNTVTILPPTTQKLVNGEAHYDLAKKDEVFTYTIETEVPKDKSKFTITDKLVDELEIVDTPTINLESTIVNGQTVNPPTPQVNGQTVSLYMNKDLINVYGGKKVVLTIKAKIKSNADLSNYEDGNVPNTAVIAIDDKEQETNTATVAPPTPKKTVNGADKATITNLDDVFTYEVTAKISPSAEKIVVTDTLVDELVFFDKPTVNIDGVTPVVEGQTITVTLNKKQVQANLDKDLVLTFKATIKNGADVSKYLAKGKDGIPNVAYVQINDNPKVSTNEVYVTLDDDTEISKTVNGKESISIANTDEKFTYEVRGVVPKVGTTYILADELESALEFVGTPKVNLSGVEAKVSGQRIAVTFNKEQIATYGGKELVLTFDAKVKDDANLADYQGTTNGTNTVIHQIPNTALYQIDDNEPVNSNTVYVNVEKVWEAQNDGSNDGSNNGSNNGSNGSNSTSEDLPKTLPQTGDSGMNFNVLFIGLALMSLSSVIGFYLYRRYKRLEQGEI